MALALTNELREKIASDIFWNPGDYSILGSQHKDSSYSRNAGINFSEHSFSSNKSTLPKNKKKKYDDNSVFLASVYSAVEDAYNDDEIETWIVHNKLSEMKSYLNGVIGILGIGEEVIKDMLPDNYPANVGEYLTDNLIESEFDEVKKGKMSKPEFRNFVNDVSLLAEKWDRKQSGNNREWFFNFISEKYGLNQSKYFCCPFCGEIRLKGFPYCPKCMDNVEDQDRIKSNNILRDRILNGASFDKQENLDVNNENTVEVLNEETSDRNELQSRIELLEAKLNEVQAENTQKLKEVSDKSDEIAKYQQQIEELLKIIADKNQTISEITKYNNNNNDYFDVAKKPKILIFGENSIPKGEIDLIAKDVGFNDIQIELFNEYSKLKNQAIRIKKDGSYSGVIVGPLPHKIKGTYKGGSPVSLFDFTFVVEAKTSSQELRITRESLRAAFSKMYNHLELNYRI